MWFETMLFKLNSTSKSWNVENAHFFIDIELPAPLSVDAVVNGAHINITWEPLEAAYSWADSTMDGIP